MDIDAYKGVAETLKERILALIPDHPEILTLESPFDLFQVDLPATWYEDLDPFKATTREASPSVSFAQSAGVMDPDEETTFSWSLAKSGPVAVSIYSIDGSLVRSLVDKTAAAGGGSAVWDARDDRGEIVAGGLYMVELKTEEGRQTRKVCIIR